MSRLALKAGVRRQQGPNGPTLFDSSTDRSISITQGEDVLVSLMGGGKTPEELHSAVVGMGVPVRIENVRRALGRLSDQGLLVNMDTQAREPSVVVNHDASDDIERPTEAFLPPPSNGSRDLKDTVPGKRLPGTKRDNEITRPRDPPTELLQQTADKTLPPQQPLQEEQAFYDDADVPTRIDASGPEVAAAIAAARAKDLQEKATKAKAGLQLGDVVPTFRTDLEIKRASGQGHHAVVEVIDPTRHRKFSLYDFEITIARMLNGRRLVSEVIDASKRLGLAVTLDSFQKFVRQLELYGFLEATTSESPPPPGPSVLAPQGPWPQREAWTEESRALFQSGVRMLRLGDPGQAVTYFSALVRLDPANAEAQEMLRLAQTQASQAARGGPAPDEFDPPTEAVNPAMVGRPPSGPPAPEELAPELPPELPAEPPTNRSSGMVEDLIDAQKAESGQRRRKIRRRILTAAVVVAAALIPFPLNVSGECVVLPLEKATIRAPTSAFVRSVEVTEGAWVEPGAQLAQLATEEAQARLQRAEAELLKAQSSLNILKGGARPEELKQAQLKVGGLARSLMLAQAERARVRSLVQKKLAAAEEQSRAEQALANAQAALSQANAELRVLTSGARPEEIQKGEAEVRARQADAEQVRREVAAATLRSPIAGVITTPRLAEKLNSKLAEGSVFCDVENTKQMRVVARISERELDVVRVGEEMSVKVANLPSRVFTGKVTFISPTIEEDTTSGARFFRVETVVDNSDGMLRSNLSGYAKVHIDTRPMISIATRGLVRWLRLRFLV